MCRFVFHEYRDHLVCFTCRKMFRQWMKHRKGQTVSCPQCHAPMADMGKDFKAPRQADVRQWRKVRLLYLNGHNYASCGCGGYGPNVKTMCEVAPFLKAHGEYKARRLHDAANNRRKDEILARADERFCRKQASAQRRKQQAVSE